MPIGRKFGVDFGRLLPPHLGARGRRGGGDVRVAVGGPRHRALLRVHGRRQRGMGRVGVALQSQGTKDARQVSAPDMLIDSRQGRATLMLEMGTER